MKSNFDVVIIGAGMAGMTAAIYLKRANINVVMIEKTAPGGQINKTNCIENYPGFNKIDGPTLAFNVFNQTQSLGIPYKYGNVLDVKVYDDYKVVLTDKEEYVCKGVIIATGRRSKELGLEKEKSLINKGISWCALCDAPLYKNLEVAVVGNNEHAIEECLMLSDICSKVYLIYEKGLNKYMEVLNSRNNIVIRENGKVIRLISNDNKLESVDIESNTKLENIKVSGLFILIGSVPSSEIFKNISINMDEDYIVVDENMRTNINGVYACGDIIKKEVYQVSTAVGEGAKAAMSYIKDFN